MSTTMAYDIYDPGFADVTKFGNSTCCRFQWRTLKQRLQNQASFSFLCFSRDDPNFNCKFCTTKYGFIIKQNKMACISMNLHHYHVLLPLREIWPCVLSLQASQSFAQLPASTQPLNPSSPCSLSTVLRHVHSLLVR